MKRPANVAASERRVVAAAMAAYGATAGFTEFSVPSLPVERRLQRACAALARTRRAGKRRESE